MIHFSLSYLQIYIIMISLISFVLYGFDKARALSSDKKISRVSEFSLLLSSLVGGSFGSLAAMFLFRHKIKKLSFMLKFIIICALQLGVLFYMLKS